MAHQRFTLRAMCIAFCIASGLAGRAQATEIHFDFENQEIVLSEVPAETNIAFFGGGHRLIDTVTYSESRATLLSDDDQDGEITFPFERRLPEMGAFLAANISTGDITIASPDGASRQTPFPVATFSLGGTNDELLLVTGRARLLLIRPSIGAWQLEQLEQDGPGSMRARAALMSGLGTTAEAPSSFQAGDLLALYDPVATTLAVHLIQSVDIEVGTFGPGGD